MGAEGGALVYLSTVDVERAMPDVTHRLALARRAMTALVADAELPPKIGVHPRQGESFAHAMPAFVRGAAVDGSQDLLGLKWVAGFPGNGALNLPAIHASVLMSDPRTGQPRALLDGGPITAHRTAAVSGVAMQTWLPAADPSTLRIALIGAGVQARSHLTVLAHLFPGSTLVVNDRYADRAETLAQEALDLGEFSGASGVADPIAAVTGADVVITLASFGPNRQGIPASAFAAAQLIVAVDYDMCVPASVAAAARTFAVDERGQFLANRDKGIFTGYPDPGTTIGETLLGGGTESAGSGSSGGSGTESAGSGAVLVTHLGVGVADLIFAEAVLLEAERLGLGARLAA
jgi:Ornithine cyclodeaminase/mu-crystallin family